MLRGNVTDYGDLVHIETWAVKGRPRRLRWHIGAPFDTTPADRVVRGVATPSNRKADLIMDLLADKQVPLSVGWTDELENPTAAPAGAVIAFTGDNPAVIQVNDNGDGSAQAVATGVLGTANVHMVADWDGGHVEGDLQIVVVPGLAERAAIVAGEPVEVTPDA